MVFRRSPDMELHSDIGVAALLSRFEQRAVTGLSPISKVLAASVSCIAQSVAFGSYITSMMCIVQTHTKLRTHIRMYELIGKHSITRKIRATCSDRKKSSSHVYADVAGESGHDCLPSRACSFILRNP